MVRYGWGRHPSAVRAVAEGHGPLRLGRRCLRATPSSGPPRPSGAGSPAGRSPAPGHRCPGSRSGRLIGATVTEVETRGKHLLIRLSTGDVLHTHMGMTGSWHVYPAGERWFRPASQARLILEAGDRVAVCFNVPVVELLSSRDEALHPSLSRLGPDILGDCAGPGDGAPPGPIAG